MAAGQEVGVAIVGCGLIGQKRAKSIGPARLIACADVQLDRAEAVARLAQDAVAYQDWRHILDLDKVDVVIVATTNDALAEVTISAVQAGKHVLVEKPAARSVDEVDGVIEAVQETEVQVRVGFNHRYHPALLKAHELFQADTLGELMFIRGRYGHGGRSGYEAEWRADPEVSGGGELIDQGVHLIDLARWFLGDFDDVYGIIRTYFWQMPVEDNGFMLLKTSQQQVAFLHVSWTEWKNLFSFEIFGREAKLQIDGLGGSYGVERLTYYKMLPELGPPKTTTWEYPMEDNSWQLEFLEFLEDIRHARTPAVNLTDAKAALEIVDKIYRGVQQ